LESHRHWLAFAVLSFFFLVWTFVWLHLDRSPPAWDDAYYLTNSLVMYDSLTSGGLVVYAKTELTVMGTKQQNYRATAAGKEKRNGQSRRYRQRVRSRHARRICHRRSKCVMHSLATRRS